MIICITRSIYAIRPSLLGVAWSIAIFFALGQFSSIQLVAQDRIRMMVLDLAKGKEQAVLTQLKKIDPTSTSQDPGIRFVRSLIEKNAVTAVTMLHDIVHSSRSSDWADDAQWRIVQIYALLKDTARAHEELAYMEEHFSFSPFLKEAKTVVEFMVGSQHSTSTQSSAKRISDGTVQSRIAVSSGIKKSSQEESTPTHSKKKSDEFVLPFKVVAGKIVANKPTESENKGDKSRSSVSETKQEKAKAPNEKTDITSSQKKVSNTERKQETEEKDSPKKESTQKEPSKKESSKKEDEEASSGSFTMQVGVFKSEEAAKNEQGKYSRMRMRTSIFEKEIAGETVYAVLVGNYATKADAETQRRLVQRVCNCPAFIVQK